MLTHDFKEHMHFLIRRSIETSTPLYILPSSINPAKNKQQQQGYRKLPPLLLNHPRYLATYTNLQIYNERNPHPHPNPPIPSPSHHIAIHHPLITIRLHTHTQPPTNTEVLLAANTRTPHLPRRPRKRHLHQTSIRLPTHPTRSPRRLRRLRFHVRRRNIFGAVQGPAVVETASFGEGCLGRGCEEVAWVSVEDEDA